MVSLQSPMQTSVFPQHGHPVCVYRVYGALKVFVDLRCCIPHSDALKTDVTMTMTWSTKPTGKLKFQLSTHNFNLGQNQKLILMPWSDAKLQPKTSTLKLQPSNFHFSDFNLSCRISFRTQDACRWRSPPSPPPPASRPSLPPPAELPLPTRPPALPPPGASSIGYPRRQQRPPPTSGSLPRRAPSTASTRPRPAPTRRGESYVFTCRRRALRGFRGNFASSSVFVGI